MRRVQKSRELLRAQTAGAPYSRLVMEEFAKNELASIYTRELLGKYSVTGSRKETACNPLTTVMVGTGPLGSSHVNRGPCATLKAL